MSAADPLPAAYHPLAPELEELAVPAEKTSDCANCPMGPQPTDRDPPVRMVFHSELRCCTYNPVLYNYLVGRILRRGGPGADKVRARLADPSGVNGYGIRPPQSFYDVVKEQPEGGFGVDGRRICPYWTPDPGGRNCTIWADRNAVCRSWFCRHDDGMRGRDFWNARRDVLRVVQVKLCNWLNDIGQPPAPDTASIDEWCTFFEWSAGRLDAATPEELAALSDDPDLLEARTVLRDRHRDLVGDQMPEVLGPCVSAFFDYGEDQVLLDGYSHYNPAVWPRTVFTLFSVMNGESTWRQALDQANELLGAEVFTERDIRELYRLGMLEARVPEDLIPGARLKGVPADWVTSVDQDEVAFEWPFGEG